MDAIVRIVRRSTNEVCWGKRGSNNLIRAGNPLCEPTGADRSEQLKSTALLPWQRLLNAKSPSAHDRNADDRRFGSPQGNGLRSLASHVVPTKFGQMATCNGPILDANPPWKIVELFELSRRLSAGFLSMLPNAVAMLPACCYGNISDGMGWDWRARDPGDAGSVQWSGVIH